ncbi:MAG: glutamate formimidoyltransferase [Bacteroidia bacterium]|nr:glutamate formimidoyltransferase [Bacteroidia bacterium]
MEPVLLCTPNFSEGKNGEVIQAIVNAIGGISGVKVMGVDKGQTVNRTVVAFGGVPESVFRAARAAYEVAIKHIDMRQHKGSHPRIGAVDVCPFTPYRGVELAWLKAEVERFAREIADLFRLPVYLYADSARSESRRRLPDIRKGGYEKLPERLRDPEWAPDYGPIVPNPRAGATVIGVRDFIAAFNLTLNSRSETIARRIAQSIREREGGLAHVQALGWYLPEVGFAQVSLNVLNLKEMPLYKVFEAVEEAARSHGVRVTETEIIGILPEWALVDAGRYFLTRAGEGSEGVSTQDLVDVAVRSLMLAGFRPEERLPERVFGPAEVGPDLGELSLRELVWQLAEREKALSPAIAVIIQSALALSVAARIAAGLPARNAFSHAEYMQLLQDTLLALQHPTVDLETIRSLSKKVLRGFALLRQMGDVLSSDQRDTLLLLLELFSGAVESLAAAYLPFQAEQPELAQEKHDVELQGRFFHEEILNRLRV